MSNVRKILLVEDETDLREILGLVLESEIENIEIFETSSGNEAMKFLEENADISLVISDYTMFDGTGGDLFLHLKETGSSVPFILLTGGYIEDYHEFKDADSVGFFKGVHYKPFESDALSELVNKVLDATVSEPCSSTSEEGTDDCEPSYFEFPIEVFEKVSYLHIDTFTKIGDAKFVKIISETDKNPIEQFFHFKQKGIKSIYIEKKDLSKYLLKAQEFLIHKFSNNAKVMEKAEFGDYIFEFSKVALDFVGVSEQVYEIVNEQVNQITQDVAKNKNLKKMLAAAADSENYLSSHCIMVAYLCVNLLNRCNLSEPSNIKKLIIASLFHDISLSDQRLARVKHITDRLSASDKNIVLNHMDKACEFIEKIVKVGEEDIFNIIKASQERPDGSGFPKGLHNKSIQPLTAIFIFAHELIDYFFESDFNLKGMKSAVEKFPECWKEGNFAKPYKVIMDCLSNDETN